MAHNEDMLARRADWAGKVEFAAVGLDDSAEALEKRVEEKNWKRVRHFWNKRGWEGAPSDYGVEGIPKVRYSNRCIALAIFCVF